MNFVELRGLTVRQDAFELAHKLEARGHRLFTKDGVLQVTSASQLGADDRKLIRELRTHLLAIAEYRCDPR